eukprot:Pgem_evm1s5726
MAQELSFNSLPLEQPINISMAIGSNQLLQAQSFGLKVDNSDSCNAKLNTCYKGVNISSYLETASKNLTNGNFVCNTLICPYINCINGVVSGDDCIPKNGRASIDDERIEAVNSILPLMNVSFVCTSAKLTCARGDGNVNSYSIMTLTLMMIS